MSHKSSMEHPDLAFKPAHDHVEETPVVVEIESFRVLGLDPDDAEFYSNYPEAKRKKVVRKVGLFTPFTYTSRLILQID